MDILCYLNNQATGNRCIQNREPGKRQLWKLFYEERESFMCKISLSKSMVTLLSASE